MKTLITHATIINEGRSFCGSVLLDNDRIAAIISDDDHPANDADIPADRIIDATGMYLLPGVIDAHVHFREPGLTHKADILSESRAAAAGGVTSIMDMPNTHPQTTTREALEAKLALLDERCIVNHSCYYGATNDNYVDFAALDRTRVCGIKLFMGSSTGNMLVDRLESLQRIFTSTDMLIAAHCEDTALINQQIKLYKERYAGEEDIPVRLHPAIRGEEACYRSSALAVRMAIEAGARLHLLHVSTARELELLPAAPAADTFGETGARLITAEACVAHLIFSDADYDRLGTRIKCNPAIKHLSDRDALRQAVCEGRITTIATDHAPHLISEKLGGATRAMSGMPMIQFSLVSMLRLVDERIMPIETVVERMCHAPARLFRIYRRGFIRVGYKADIVLVSHREPWTLTPSLIASQCGWSPLEGETFGWRVAHTFINGHEVYDGTRVDESYRGEALRFGQEDTV